MKIIVTRCSTKYTCAELIHDNIRVDLGMLNIQEQKELAKIFKEASDDLSYGLKEDEEVLS